MTDTIEVLSVSEVAKVIKIEDYPPLTDKNLEDIIDGSKYGLAMHLVFDIPDDEPLPIHIHPKTLLSMVQEIQACRIYCWNKRGESQ